MARKNCQHFVSECRSGISKSPDYERFIDSAMIKMAGGAIGTVIAGPIGGAIGTAVGSFIG